MAKLLRLALIADIHYGADSQTKWGSAALTLLNAALAEIDAYQPDMLIDLGDRISDEDPKTDARLLREVAERFERVRAPRVHLLGNHDLEYLPLKTSEALLGTPLRHHVVEQDGWQLIFWHADPHYRKGNLSIAEEDLNWLEATLSGLSQPSVIFTHVPFSGGSMVGNYYFADRPVGRAEHKNAAEARALVEASDHVSLVVAGHTHWNALHTSNGIHHLTIQSLSETFTTHPEAAGAWVGLELGEQIELEVYGRDPFHARLPLRRAGHHWLRAGGGRLQRYASPEQALENVRGIILDLDGVVYAGGELLPGAQEFIALVRGRGWPIVAVTNHAGRTAEEVRAKLAGLGVTLAEHEIITSSWAAAHYLAAKAPQTKALVVGGEALEHELLEAGLHLATDVDEADVVVVGYTPEMSPTRLRQATRCLLQGAQLLGTNADRLLPTPEGPIPECGPLLAYLEQASGQQARVIGKPQPYITRLALSRLGLEPSQALIVGDNPETDIAAGVRSGIRTVFVHNPHGLASPKSRQASVTVRDLAELCTLMDASGGRG